NCLHHSPGGRLAQGLSQERHGPRLVTFQRLAEQLLLVPEGSVEAWSVDPHGPGQLRERGTLVAACPEHLQCPVQCLIHVELSRTPRGHGDLLYKKCCRPLTGTAGPRTLSLYRTVQETQGRRSPWHAPHRKDHWQARSRSSPAVRAASAPRSPSASPGTAPASPSPTPKARTQRRPLSKRSNAEAERRSRSTRTPPTPLQSAT